MREFKLDVLIVEDNLSFSLELEMQLEEIGYHVIGRVDNSGEALDIIYSKEPDLILMDIDIKGHLTGVEIGTKIKHLNIPILYITSFGDDEHYAAAQASNMIGYLVKPIEKYTLKTTLQLMISNAFLGDKAEPKINHKDTQFLANDHLYIKKKGVFHKVLIDSIAYVQSHDNYCETITIDGNIFVSRTTISSMEELLPAKNFIRSHRKFIVNLTKIDLINFQDSTIKIEQKELPISRAKRKELASRINMLS